MRAATTTLLLALVVVVHTTPTCPTAKWIAKSHPCLPDEERHPRRTQLLNIDAQHVKVEIERIMTTLLLPHEVAHAMRMLEYASMELRRETTVDGEIVFDGKQVTLTEAAPKTLQRLTYLNRILALANSSDDQLWESSFFFQHARNHLVSKRGYQHTVLDYISALAFATKAHDLAHTNDTAAAALLIRHVC